MSVLREFLIAVMALGLMFKLVISSRSHCGQSKRASNTQIRKIEITHIQAKCEHNKTHSGFVMIIISIIRDGVSKIAIRTLI